MNILRRTGLGVAMATGAGLGFWAGDSMPPTEQELRAKIEACAALLPDESSLSVQSMNEFPVECEPFESSFFLTLRDQQIFLDQAQAKADETAPTEGATPGSQVEVEIPAHKVITKSRLRSDQESDIVAWRETRDWSRLAGGVFGAAAGLILGGLGISINEAVEGGKREERTQPISIFED